MKGFLAFTYFIHVALCHSCEWHSCECDKSGIDDEVAEYYVRRIIPILYPAIEASKYQITSRADCLVSLVCVSQAGGVHTHEEIEALAKRVRDDNPSMMDALILDGLNRGTFGNSLHESREYLKYFRRGWKHTVGDRVQHGTTNIDGAPLLSVSIPTT